MKKTTKKVVALALSFSIASAATACSLGGDKKDKKDKDDDSSAIEETVDKFMGYVVSGKDDKAGKLTESGEAVAYTLDDDQQAVYDAVISNTTYEISDVDGSADDEEGSAVVTITMPEVSVDDCASIDDVIAALDDADTIEEEIEIALVYDDDFIITDDSAEDVYNVIIENVTSVDYVFAAAGEDAVLSVVDSFFLAASSGDIAAANAYTLNQDDMDESATMGEELVATYFSGIDYTATVTSITDTDATVQLTGTRPDIQGAAQDIQTPDNLARLMAESLYCQFNNITDQDEIMNSVLPFFCDVLVEGMNSRSSVAFDATIDLTLDDNGQWKIVEGSDLMPDMDDAFNLDGVSEDVQMQAIMDGLNILNDEGRIDPETYALYMGLLTMDGAGADGRDPSEISLDGIPLMDETGTYYEGESEDLFTMHFLDADEWYVYSYAIGDAAINCHITTWAYYDTDSVFDYDVYCDGEYVESGVAVIGDDTDEVYMTYAPAGGLTAGDYAFVLYDQGATTVHSVSYVTVE